MTVYNAEQFVAEAIDSILNQTYTHFELLILNDASTDKTEQIVLEKQRLDPRIKYFINEQNSGLSKTKNKLIPFAQGEYIALTDADDINAPERFEKQVAILNAHKDTHIVGSAVNLINTKGVVCDTWHYPTEDAEIKKGLETSTTIANPVAMFRRQVFFTIGGYDERLVICEDWDFYYRASKHFNFKNIAESLLFYRFHETNTSVTKLEYTVMYGVYFRYKLPMSCFKHTLVELVFLYPEYTETICYNVNRFYSFSMDTFLKLDYPALSDKLYQQVKDHFFIFFDKHSKKIFIKSAIVVHLKNRRFQKLPRLLKDYIFLR